MSIKKKLQFNTIVVLVGLLITLGSVYWMNVWFDKKSKEVESLYQINLIGSQINTFLHEAKSEEVQFLLTDDRTHANHTQQALKQLTTQIEVLRDQTTLDTVRQRANQLLDYVSNYVTDYEELMQDVGSIGSGSSVGMLGDASQVSKKVESVIQLVDNDELEVAMLKIKSTEKDFLIYLTPSFITPFEQNTQQLERLIHKHEMNESHKNQLLAGLADYKKTLMDVFRIKLKLQEMNQTFNNMTDMFQTEIMAIQQEINAVLDRVQSDKQQYTRNIYFLIALISLLIIGTTIVSGTWLFRTVMTSILKLQEGANIIGKGNMTHTVMVKGDDEMDNLAKTFNIMADKVRMSLQKVDHTAKHLLENSKTLAHISNTSASQTQEIHAALEQLTAGAENQVDNLQECASRLEGVTEQLTMIEVGSQEIGRQAILSTMKSQEGVETLRTLEQTAGELITFADHIYSHIQSTGRRFEDIIQILDVISDIASTTNLLAVNAAIEASRATESGKGFHVISNEIRKLAVRTKNEAQQIHQLAEGIMSEVSWLTKEVGQLFHYGQKHSEQVEKTKLVFNDIVIQVGSIQEGAGNISLKVTHANNASNELSNFVGNVLHITNEFSRTTEYVSAQSENQLEAVETTHVSADSLLDLANGLITETNKFKFLPDNMEAS